MKKFRIRHSIITKCFSIIILINIVMAVSSLVIQNFFMENIYFHSKIDSIEKNIIDFENTLMNEGEENNQSLAKAFNNDNDVEVVIMDNNLDIIDDSILQEFNYILINYENRYIKVLTDYLVNVQGRPLSQQLNSIIGSRISIKGFSIAGTDYLESKEIILNETVYTNYNIYPEDSISPKNSELQSIDGAEVIDVQYKNTDFRISNQGRKLWIKIKPILYNELTSQELIEIVDENSETTYLDSQLNEQVYYKINYVKNERGQCYFYAMLFTLEEIQPVFITLNKYFIRQYVFFILLIIIIGFILDKKFKKPMKQIKDYANDIALADFTSTLDIRSNDETGDLCHSLNQISENLSLRINEINKRALEKEKEEKRLRILLASMSHEFKTPLGIISGFVEMIKDGIKKEKTDYYLTVIDDEINRLNSLVLETMELMNYESGTVKIMLEPFEIRRCIENICSRFDNELTEKNLKIVLKVVESNVIGDIHKIERVLYNLISNAIKYSLDSQEISIYTVEKIDCIYIFIENIGDRIPAEEINKIWEMFYRTDESRNRLSGGNGLGLAIVKNILELHSSDKGVTNHANGVRMYFSLKKDNLET